MIESGAIIHAFVGENCPDARAIEELVTNVFRRTQCAQLTISPEYTYCQSCHQRMSGLRDRCPHCGSEDTMGITRVVGYFSIRLVNLLASKGKFGAFAYYCWAAGIVSLIAVFMGF